jgi:predicted DNA-binding transcriptional regulator YafY
MRLERLLAIVMKLLNRDKISATELAEEFEVSIRTIYRDIESINLAGIPIISFQGQQGGFGVVENYRLDHQVLTLQEISSILSVLRGFHGVFPDKKIAHAAEKIQNMVPKDKKKEVSAQFEQIVIEALPWGENPKQKRNLSVVQSALASNRILKCSYQNSKGEKNIRRIEPMTLIYKAYIWYLFGFCRLKNDYRFFRLTRMNQLQILSDTFNRRDRSYKEFYKNETQTMPKLVAMTLKFSAQVRHRVEDAFDTNQIKAQKDGSVTIHVSWPEDQGLYMFLLSFGENLKVINPLEIQRKIKDMARKVYEQYVCY